MSNHLPLFPLQLVVYPEEILKLHIFEPRYKQLLGECRDANLTFGIPAYLEGAIAEYGTEMRLLRVLKNYPTGEMDILSQGYRAFHVDKFEPQVTDKLYPGGYITPLENVADSYSVTVEELARQFARFHEILKTGRTLEGLNFKNVSFHIAQEVGLTLPQKVHLLSLPKESDRQLYLINHLHEIVPVLEGVEDTRRRVRGNGHFRNLPTLNL